MGELVHYQWALDELVWQPEELVRAAVPSPDRNFTHDLSFSARRRALAAAARRLCWTGCCRRCSPRGPAPRAASTAAAAAPSCTRRRRSCPARRTPGVLGPKITGCAALRAAPQPSGPPSTSSRGAWRTGGGGGGGARACGANRLASLDRQLGPPHSHPCPVTQPVSLRSQAVRGAPAVGCAAAARLRCAAALLLQGAFCGAPGTTAASTDARPRSARRCTPCPSSRARSAAAARPTHRLRRPLGAAARLSSSPPPAASRAPSARRRRRRGGTRRPPAAGWSL